MSRTILEKLPRKIFENFVISSKTYKEILEKANCKTYTQNNKIVRELCEKYNIDYSHLNIGKKENLIGQQFGYMKVISEDINKNGTKTQNAFWFCECQACQQHTIKSVCGADLKRGRVTNCGCQKIKRIVAFNHTNFKDLSGQKFGKLLVLYPIFYEENFSNLYKCKCECGKETTVARSSLISGGTISCGCLKTSFGELRTEETLKELKINYIKQYKFNDLIGEKYKLSFDFAIFIQNKIMLIECQGQQHYQVVDYFGGKEQFKKQQLYDNKKREYCKNNNIKLIEIPYTDYNKISPEYLLNLITQ